MLNATINQETFFAFVHLCIHVKHREFLHILFDDDNLMKWGWVARLGWEVNNRSVYEDESVKIWVGSLVNCCKPNWDVIASILETS